MDVDELIRTLEAERKEVDRQNLERAMAAVEQLIEMRQQRGEALATGKVRKKPRKTSKK